ncbi:hypothetical protein CVT24_001614 [Panaeolus cyanescens]|uniref:Uncharacterized protein n=1 Tax=Panaeolus cyanescens TaxID=181874 RepID=A0A409W3H6_9AGAR|nr:hypothetical protein CVT24_001614 [Panaeolus cyanescens]
MSGNYDYNFPTDNQLSPSGSGSSPPSEAPSTYKTSATRLDMDCINDNEQLPISRGVQYGGGRRREEDFLDSTITPTKLRPTITARKGLDEALPPSKDGKLFEERVLERRRELQGNAQGTQGCYVDSSGRRFHPTLHLPKDHHHQRHRSNSAGSQSSMMSHSMQTMDSAISHAYPQQGYMPTMQTYEPQASLFQYHPASPMMMQHLLPHLSSPYPPYPVYSQGIQSYGPYLPDVNSSTYNQVYEMDISNEQDMEYNNLSAAGKGADGQPAKTNLAGSQAPSFSQVPAQASSTLPPPTITVQSATPVKNLGGNTVTTEVPAPASSNRPPPTITVQSATPVKNLGGNTNDALLTANTLQSSSIPAPELHPAAPDSYAVHDGGQQPSAPPAISNVNDAKDMQIQMPEVDEHSDLDIGKFSDDEEDDQAAGGDSLKLPGGRPSKAKEKIMAGYVSQIRKLALEAAAQTGLTVSYIMTQASDSSDTRSGNCWNTWQRGYFEQFREEELERLGIDPKDRPPAGSPVLPSIIKSAYKRFMSEHGSRGIEILRAWDAIQKFQDANMTVQQRVSHFKKETKKIKRLLDNLAASFNFQSALISVGGVVNQDQALCITHETSMADGFLQSLIANKDEEVFRGLFRSHVYGKAGQQYLEKMQNPTDPPPPAQPSCPQPEEAEETNKVPSSNTESATRKIQEDAIRDCLENLFGPKSKMENHIHPRFLWRALGKELGKPSRRLTLLNWPEVAGFPTSNKSNKGLADLTSEKRSALYRAVKDEKFPLSKRRWDWAGNSTADNSPVIQCLPMKDQRALCLYADGRVARDGQTLKELVAGLPAPPSKVDKDAKDASVPAGSTKAKSVKKGKGKGKGKAQSVAPKSMSIIDTDSESELDAAPTNIEGPPSSTCSAEQDPPEDLNISDRSQHSLPPIDSRSALYPPFTQKDKSDDEDVFFLSPKEKKQARLKPDAVMPVHGGMQHASEQTNLNRTPTKSKSSAPPTNKTPTSKPFVKKRERDMSTSSFDKGSSADEDDKRSKRSRTGSTTSSQWGDNLSDKYMFDDHYSDNIVKDDAWNDDRYSSHQGPGSREMIRRRQSPLPSSGYPHPTAMHPYYPGHPGIPPIHPGGSPFYFPNHSPYPPPPPPNHNFRAPPRSLYGHMAPVPSYNPMYPSLPGHTGPSRPSHLYQNSGHTRQNSADAAYGQRSRCNHQDDDLPSPPRPPRWTGRREQRYDQEGNRQGRRAQKYDQEDM